MTEQNTVAETPYYEDPAYVWPAVGWTDHHILDWEQKITEVPGGALVTRHLLCGREALTIKGSRPGSPLTHLVSSVAIRDGHPRTTLHLIVGRIEGLWHENSWEFLDGETKHEPRELTVHRVFNDHSRDDDHTLRAKSIESDDLQSRDGEIIFAPGLWLGTPVSLALHHPFVWKWVKARL